MKIYVRSPCKSMSYFDDHSLNAALAQPADRLE